MKRSLKKFMALGMVMIMVLSTTIVAYATTKTNSAKKGSYTMNYTLTGTKSTSAGATTDSDGATDVVAYVGIYSYKNSKVKNSTSGQQLAYVYKLLKSKGGNKFVSYHNLKDTNYKPIGNTLTLTIS